MTGPAAPPLPPSHRPAGPRAAVSQRDHPAWLITYGTHSRVHYALPLFTAPRGAMLADSWPPCRMPCAARS
jgi:hypothetical protein